MSQEVVELISLPAQGVGVTDSLHAACLLLLLGPISGDCDQCLFYMLQPVFSLLHRPELPYLSVLSGDRVKWGGSGGTYWSLGLKTAERT